MTVREVGLVIVFDLGEGWSFIVYVDYKSNASVVLVGQQQISSSFELRATLALAKALPASEQREVSTVGLSSAASLV